MPVDADSKPRASLPQHASGAVTTSSPARSIPHDLTYN
jgi:hypothetical protein